MNKLMKVLLKSTPFWKIKLNKKKLKICKQKYPTQKLIKLSLPLPIKFARIKKERIDLPQKLKLLTKKKERKKERKRVSSKS